MARRFLSLLACFAIIGGGLASSARLASSATIDVLIAKTQAAIDPFGIVEPARPRRNVTVKLSVDKGDGFEVRRTKKVPLDGNSDSDGDGVAESTFDTRFDRPRDGTCRIVALFRRAGRTTLRDEEEFPCAVPKFGSGTAMMTSDSGTVEIELMIAETDEQRGYGLMYRRRLAQDRGMAFLFSGDTTTPFYMANTLIPLSIAFIDGTNRIVRILDMEPCDDDEPRCPNYDPETTYRNALEVNQGAFETWGVEVGDTIVITD